MHKLYKEVGKGFDYNYEEECPYCEEEIAVVIDDEDITHYTVKCPFCGEEIMLCGLCRMDFGAVDCEDDENGCIVCRAEKGLCNFPKRDCFESFYSVTIYADTTGLFTDEELDSMRTNLIDVCAYTEAVDLWYKEHEKEFKEETMHDLGVTEEEATFDRWFDDVCIADDFDGFYQFSNKMGYPIEIDKNNYLPKTEESEEI